jgi:hypothetical protein
MSKPFLTIGMATYDDFDGVWFSLHALKAYHDLDDVELIVVDNKPEGCPDTKAACEWIGARYLHRGHSNSPSLAKQIVFEEAQGDWVLCIDCHVLLVDGAISRLKKFLKEEADFKSMYQGPLLYDNHKDVATHFKPEWRGGMWGTWATDERHTGDVPFEIPMQGMGLFCAYKQEWPGFNLKFRGFGGEEGYIHQKIRKFGGKCYCVPWLKWIHRFGRPKGVPYRLVLEDRIYNYVLGRRELGLPYKDVVDHFETQASGRDAVATIVKEAEAEDPMEGVFPLRFRSKNAVAIKRPQPCVYKTSLPIDTGNCGGCSWKFVYGCAKHEKCRPYQDLGDGIRSCQDCPDYEEV